MTKLQNPPEESFGQVSARIRACIGENRLDQVEMLADDYCQRQGDPARQLLVQALVHYLRLDHRACLAKLNQARTLLRPENLAGLDKMYTAALVHSQLSLPRRQRPATAQGFRFYRRNIEALRRVDAVLADEVQRSRWPDDYHLLESWDGLHLYCAATKALLSLDEQTRAKLAEHLTQRAPITFSGIGSGQELRFCLEGRIDLLYGMTRTHYLFEPEPEKIKLLGHLFDLSPFLLAEQLFIFGGARGRERRDEVFGTLRYPNLKLIVGPPQAIQEDVRIVQATLNDQARSERVSQYYAGPEFHRRLREIADGTIRPRILVATCRWTTFLKHCARDFEKAFAQIGSECRFLIEENDVQVLNPALHWQQLEQFRPDVMFSVSHARTTTPYLPRELPHIAYIQDKCGPILWHPSLAGHVSRQDVFVCSLHEFQKYLWSKQVPAAQTFVMPVPTDESVFYPLEGGEELAGTYSADVSYIKHGNADSDAAFAQWMTPKGFLAPRDQGALLLAEFFQDLYRQFRRDPERRWYEQDMQEYAQQELYPSVVEEHWPNIRQLVTTFSVEVYPACRRRYYLEALAAAGIGLRLYGQGWSDDPQFARFAAGPIERGPELNAVYNFSRINLHLHPYSTMHQRLSECGLAGGFLLAADHPPEKDWEPARRYFEPDAEFVLFDTAAELVDRCRYFLAHPDQRRGIARAMHRRARRERTCRAGAETILARWRELLAESLRA
ncbi:MAG: glycosyltransferase family 1 protein [Sedimentisphaerales bacterium]|nr:glycosyltransferase family 1 protein [Sedimentisphaerales bacterium]